MRIKKVCVGESEREGEIEGLYERENKEIDENNVRNEKWTKEWMKYGIERKARLSLYTYLAEVPGIFPAVDEGR